jgi:polysaccharide biosynthesis protein PslH
MRILVALSRFPWPLEKGDKLRAWHQLQGLALAHEVHLVCLSDVAVSAADLAALGFCKSVQVIRQGKVVAALNVLRGLFNRIPFQVNYFRSRRMRSLIAQTIAREKIDVCFVQLVRLGENLPMASGPRWVLDYMDTFSIGMESRIAESKVWMRPIVRKEAKRLKAYESRLAAHFDELVIISDRDAEGLPPALRDVVHVIPNGVSESFFEALPQPAQKDFDLIFFGNMGYQPNVKGAQYLVEEVLPILHKRGIRPRLCIAGARPAAVLKAYESAEITVTGFVDDIRQYVLRSKISVAPLIGGQGLQNKLIESMAMTMPVITTPISNAALGANAGVELLVAADPVAFADAIELLLHDPGKAAELAANGRRFVEAHFRWGAMNARLIGVLGDEK